ncbi:uncharacterized protein SPSC_04601 [Sporisorium scitamineum]|uniref:Uncharacterized protein n=1 Tax=Sporisorium scitamineum TaxID=49012 RepID=A0A0F7S734_9BASI|nr:uncharacterized protein SPSC_04601 [Sporisorium scitamineum]CDW98181.1 hypothetical protein [Sporisorium scitamineum]
MVAKTTRPTPTSSSSAALTSKPKSSIQASSLSSQSSKPTSLVQSSAKKTLKAAKKKSNKFRDSEKRELLDGQTSQLLASTTTDGRGTGEGERDPFSYAVESKADQRRTRRQVDETALALDMLMKS